VFISLISVISVLLDFLFNNFTANTFNMTTIIINEKTKKGRIILDLIREIGVGKIIENNMESENILNNTTLKAIKEANEGNTIKCIDFDDYLKKVE